MKYSIGHSLQCKVYTVKSLLLTNHDQLVSGFKLNFSIYFSSLQNNSHILLTDRIVCTTHCVVHTVYLKLYEK